jgi:uncharacterized protein (DUF2249 family)
MQKIDVNGATVDFFKSEKEGITFYRFDTSKTPPPEPMVNAMAGLRLLDTNARLVMINHKSPQGLFPKIEADFDWIVEDLDDGNVKVVFRKKETGGNATDFSQTSCSGGKCSH